ncbi:immunity protein 26 of polymorphic toxin system [Melghirimyces profundicolus]|uniref:Immunity protein 26 of polymorphic toxin system n=1 Tax=Melghirimyces profundicolus TaxID=1242148 RepID=A0A2T6AU74_9BACL|nr:immunity 26/phosphotriesterase HocA family protein [Melghirimyces profundicolus]PTX47371.1 immunity protein 26 of polymorphic toxin system [Melghirimyces profundicolus]
MSFDLLVKMNPSRKRPKPGDVFVIQPKKGVYYYGRVIRTKMPNKNPMMRGWNLIYIYKVPTEKIVMPDQLNERGLLIPPKIVNNQGWLKGYFQTIGSIPLQEEDYVKDYGFWDAFTKTFVDEEGNKLDFKPKMYSDYGVGSYGSVAYDVQQALEGK